eukprot:scaffold385424_cov31-Prasinocladus_malaysianus.AAC.2
MHGAMCDWPQTGSNGSKFWRARHLQLVQAKSAKIIRTFWHAARRLAFAQSGSFSGLGIPAAHESS